MKFSITKDQFLEGLQQVQHVVSTRTTLPILSNVLLEADGDSLRLTTTDLDGDGKLDLLVGLNHSVVQSFNHRAASRGSILTIHLSKPSPGAHFTCRLSDDTTQTAEWQAGGGYLSQRAPSVAFGVPAGLSVRSISVRWPDGKVTEHKVRAGQRELTATR